MRIRKNSKLIHGGNTSVSSSSSPSSFLICQLNRSPWDVLDVFSLQGEWDASFESIPASDRYSVRSGESMELSFEYVKKPPIPATTTNERENGSIVEFEAIKTPPIFRHIDHHISASPPPPLPPKKAATTTTPKRRGRPKKPATPAAANNNTPNEFYYYSGFGPSSAKRRGGDNRPFDDDSNSKNKKTKKKKEKEKEADNGVDMVDEELDYIDDDDDDEGDLYGGSKRARKPIKARSLKSLM